MQPGVLFHDRKPAEQQQPACLLVAANLKLALTQITGLFTCAYNSVGGATRWTVLQPIDISTQTKHIVADTTYLQSSRHSVPFQSTRHSGSCRHWCCRRLLCVPKRKNGHAHALTMHFRWPEARKAVASSIPKHQAKSAPRLSLIMAEACLANVDCDSQDDQAVIELACGPPNDASFVCAFLKVRFGPVSQCSQKSHSFWAIA